MEEEKWPRPAQRFFISADELRWFGCCVGNAVQKVKWVSIISPKVARMTQRTAVKLETVELSTFNNKLLSDGGD